MNMVNAARVPIAGTTTRINVGRTAITANPITPAIAIPGGNQRAGFFSDGQASHTAPITKPTRPVAAVNNRAEPSSPSRHFATAKITSNTMAITSTMVRRMSGGFSREWFIPSTIPFDLLASIAERDMRVLCFSDLHCDRQAASKLLELAEQADCMVGAGDFANRRQGAEQTLEVLAAIEKPAVLVPGNAESAEELREAARIWPSAQVLHG